MDEDLSLRVMPLQTHFIKAMPSLLRVALITLKWVLNSRHQNTSPQLR